MKRHIGLWTEEKDTKPEVAELIIEGNHIEFYSRYYGLPGEHAFVGSDGEHSYKVITQGNCTSGKYKTLNNATSYNVKYVLTQNCEYKSGLNVTDIMKCSFIIPELIGWIGKRTVDWGVTKNQELIASEMKFPIIILKNSNPHIEIYFETKTSIFDGSIDDRTTFTIENNPRICISYELVKDVSQLNHDLMGVIQFFGLMIGHVSDVADIRLDIQEQDSKSWLFINKDFSYNLRTIDIMDKPRTMFDNVQVKLQSYFENWYNFYNDCKFELIHRMYFLGNRRKEIYVEDILVQYVRILEGYHLRITGDEKIAGDIKDAIKFVEKDIKKLIFTDEGKALFTSALEKVAPQWIFNSRHATDISAWIASGYLGKMGLAERLKLLDQDFFSIIAKNAIAIETLGTDTSKGEMVDSKVDEEFYRKIVDTRNYFSHYKANADNVLNFNQMCITINVLKALIIMILYYHMGIEKELIRKIIIGDSELHFETMCLRNDYQTH